MEYVSIGRFIWSFALVLGLIGLLALLAKKYGAAGMRIKSASEARLEIVESLPIDARHRLVIIRRDDVQHLIVKGPETVQVIETGLPRRAAVQPSTGEIQDV